MLAFEYPVIAEVIMYAVSITARILANPITKEKLKLILIN